MLLLLLILVALLVLVYYTTRFVGRFAARGSIFSGGKSEFCPGRHIVLIDRFAIDREKSILLVRVDEKYYLLGASEESITLLQELEPPIETAQGEPIQSTAPLAFRGILETWKERCKHEKDNG